MFRTILTTSIVALLGTTALAAPSTQSFPGEYHVDHRDMVVEVGPNEADFLTPAQAQASGYYLLYVNRCEGGETITRGFNDSRSNSSSIIPQTTTFPAYPFGDASWNDVITEVRTILSPFGIEVTDQDPGNTPHTEIIACGQSFVGPSVLGIAPFGCSLVANAIGFAFAENHQGDTRYLAETIAHEAGHTWTLNHLYDCADPMTYLTGCGEKAFQDTALACAGVTSGGSWAQEACTCGGSTQNSYETLESYFGPANNQLPTLQLQQPAEGAIVGPGFAIVGQAQSLNGGESVEIYIDEVLQLRFQEQVIDTHAPDDIAEGPHQLTVSVVDEYNRRNDTTIEITVSASCQCQDSEYCDGEQCLAFGDLGESCLGDSTCEGGLCASNGEISLCTAHCTVGANECSNGTTCVQSGESGLCWDSSASATSGCGCQSSQGSTSLVWTLLLLPFLFSRRRRAEHNA